MDKISTVSVIIPCLNEEKHITECLDSVISNDYPKNDIEILVVDGMSTDRTREILEKYEQKYDNIKVLDNVKKTPPTALNIGIKSSRGEIIVRLDAHTVYENDYISKCVRHLNESNADNVGGIWKIVSDVNGLVAGAITMVLGHPFGVGNAVYRINTSDSPREVDTVPFGCFKKSIFEKIGYFDETIPRNEDIDFNRRIKKQGGKIMLFPDIICYYHARTKYLKYCKHNLANGIMVTFPIKYGKGILAGRHLIPLVFVSGLLVSFALSFLSVYYIYLFLFTVTLYLLTSIFFSIKIVLTGEKMIYLFILPFMFFSLHFCYGLGSIWGLVKILLPGSKENVKACF